MHFLRESNGIITDKRNKRKSRDSHGKQIYIPENKIPLDNANKRTYINPDSGNTMMCVFRKKRTGSGLRLYLSRIDSAGCIQQ